MAELWRAQSPILSALAGTGLGAPGVRIRWRDVPVVSVQALRAAPDAVAHAVLDAYGLSLPATPHVDAAGEIAAVWTGPDAWMLLGIGAADAQARLGTFAAVCDQSDGRVVLDVDGPRARDGLAKLLRLDLHPRGFPPGSAAGTLAGHVGVYLWSIDGDVFTIAVPRSYATTVAESLVAAGAEYGVTVET